MKRTSFFWTPLAVLVAAGLLWKTREVSAGVCAGLSACAAVIIPSLFPFMVLAGLISSTQVGVTLSRAVSGFTRRVLGLPEALGSILLMSMIGGFPVGARMLSAAVNAREIKPQTAEKALCFCVNAGPSFLISAVGAAMLGSARAGLFLLLAQLTSSLLIGGVLFRGSPQAGAALPPRPARRDAFTHAVREATAGTMGICAFVVAFAALSALLRALGVLDFIAGIFAALFPGLGQAFFSAAITGILEVTAGCAAAAALHTRAGFVLCAFLVSCSSLSIVFQVKSCFGEESGVEFGAFYRSRIVHGLLTAAFAALLSCFLPPECLLASAGSSAPVPAATPNMVITAACLICMCSMLLPKSKKAACRNMNK